MYAPDAIQQRLKFDRLGGVRVPCADCAVFPFCFR